MSKKDKRKKIVRRGVGGGGKSTRAIKIHAVSRDNTILEKIVDLPVSLKAATQLYGEDMVFKHFVANYVIHLQSQMRQAAAPKRRKRVTYLDLLREPAGRRGVGRGKKGRRP